MDKDILSTLINHLDSSGFDDLIFYLLKQEDDFYLSKRLRVSCIIKCPK